MKRLNYLKFTIASMFFIFCANAQDKNVSSNNEGNLLNYWQITPRAGYDFPAYDEDFEYIDYDGGLDVGLSVNKYWSNWGFQFDFDYISNSPVEDNLLNPLYIDEAIGSNGFLVGVLGQKQVKKNDISRTYFGIGPSYKYQSKSNQFIIDFAMTAGIGRVDGGEILIYADPVNPLVSSKTLISYHIGFEDQWVFTIKPGVRFNYYFNEKKNFGIHAGAYYMRHFGVEESGKSTFIRDYFIDQGMPLPNNYYIAFYEAETINVTQDGDGDDFTYYSDEGEFRGENDNVEFEGGSFQDIDVASFGVYGGLSFRIFPGNKNKKECPAGQVYCEEHKHCHAPPACCSTCPKGCNVSVTAKDKFTGKVLKNTDVVLLNGAGQNVRTGTTNSYGIVVFDEVEQGTYTVKGKLYEVDLEEEMISDEDFENCLAQGGNGTIEKEIIYTDQNFIIDGKVIECNTTVAVSGANIILKRKNIQEGQKNTVSDSEGKFRFHVAQGQEFTLKGNKDGYFSGETEVSTKEYDRNTTLEIPFEICADPCGKAIKLDNINFKVDKSDILPESIPDLMYVVKIMNENPSAKVEMSSHTDARGSDEYNLKLSQRRADSTVKWLVENGGVDRSRLTAVGMGETQLLNTKCSNGVQCTDEEHKINRRTEFKIKCD